MVNMIFEKIYYILLLCVVYAILNASGTALIKSTATEYNLINLSSYINILLDIRIVAGIALNFSSMLIIIKALSMERFTYVFPVAIGINFVVTIIIGYVVFGERLDIDMLSGILLILLGIFIMS